MSATVPESILVGDSTRYCHFASGLRDMYAPSSMFPNPPESHTWSYCISREHNDTVYFHNEPSGRSVWVLPILDSAGLEMSTTAEDMRAVGAVESAARGRSRISSFSAVSSSSSSKVSASASVSGTAGTESRRAVVRQSVAEAVQRALERKAVPPQSSTAPFTTTAVSSAHSAPSAHSAAAAAAVVVVHPEEESGSVRDRLATWRARRALQQQQQSQDSAAQWRSSSVGTQRSVSDGPQLLTTAKGRAAHTPMDQPLSYKQTQEHEQQKGQQGQQQEEQHKGQEEQEKGQHPQATLEGNVYDEKRRLFLLANEELQREKDEALRRERAALEHSRRCLEAQQCEDEERARLAAERRKLEERRVELQRRALERQKASIATADAEALSRETAHQLNDYFEKARGLEQHAETEQQKVVSFESAIAKSLLDTVTGFQSNANQGHGVLHNNHYSSFGNVGNATNTSTLDQPRCIDLRILEDSTSSSSSSSSSRLGTSSISRGDGVNDRDAKLKARAAAIVARGQRKQRSNALHGAAQSTSASAGTRCERTTHEGRIEYSPALVYIGGVTGLSGDSFNGGASAPLLKRQGHGKLYYDAAQKSFFEGEWADDKRNGRGTLSLPHVAVEGIWRDDQLDGRATFQTRRLKGTGEFAQGAPSGNAIVELDCNSVFAGSLKKNGEIRSGAMTLGSGDHVEWIEEDVGKSSAQHDVPHQTVSGKHTDRPNTAAAKSPTKHDNDFNEPDRKTNGGAGKSRIQFANGDVYVGQVLNYLPHGNGSYRFAEEGNEYIGEFHKGQIHGSGTYRFANGNVYVGQMYKGLFHGEGQYIQTGTYTYEGAWEYGTAHGEGKITFANGDVWVGKFEHDKRMDGRYIKSKLFQL